MTNREPLFVHTHSLVIAKRQGVDEPEIDVTITIREGATPIMIVETLEYYCIAVRALWVGDTLMPSAPRRDYGATPHGEAMVCCYGKAWLLLPSGKRRGVQINKCTEVTTAYELVRSIRESVQAITEFHRVTLEQYAREVEQALAPQPTTLRPSRQRVTDNDESIAGDPD